MLTSRHKSNSDYQEGFSLLEMLVVLAIMGMVLSLVIVNMISSIESARFVRTAESAVADIKLIRLQAMLDARPIKIVGTQESNLKPNNFNINEQRLNLPDGWTVSGGDIAISKTGFCSGGRISIKDNGGRIISFDLSAPKCDAARVIL